MQPAHVVWNRWQHIVQKALLRPFLLFIREPIIQLLGTYMTFVYGTLYRTLIFLRAFGELQLTSPSVFLTTLPSIFQGVYRESVGIAGLHYIALGLGLSGVSQINARLIDIVYKHFCARNGGVGKPEYRLREYFPPYAWYCR